MRSFCMNRTRFRDPRVGGVFVKTCIIAFIKLPFSMESKLITLSSLVLYLVLLVRNLK